MLVNAPILYFFPGAQKPAADLAERFHGRQGMKTDNAIGPDRKRGLLICPFTSASISYKPDRQHWEQIRDDLYIGVDQDTQPEHIQHPKASGVPVTMGDGRRWLMPVLNPISPQFTLPTVDKFLIGQWRTVVADPHRSLVQECQRLVGHITQAMVAATPEGLEIETDICRPIIAAALAHNYDITMLELSALSVFSADTYYPAIAAIIDIEEVVRALRANIQEAARSTPNPTDGPPGTSPTNPGEQTSPSPTTQPSPIST